MFNSMHLIDICELAPPYFVTKPLILCEKIKSKPGSAFSIKIIKFFKATNFFANNIFI